jgi:hypothetical protein
MDAMRRGDEAEAWAIADAELANRDAATRDDPRLPYHRRWVWDGRPFLGRNVVVRCYHGLGDVVQFARYLPVLKPLCRRLTVEAQPELLPLLASMSPVGHLVPFDPASPSPSAECDIEIMELSHALRIGAGGVPVPYLRVSPTRHAAAHTRTGATRPVLGLCWQAGDWDPHRSVPLPALLASLPPGLRLINLQRLAGGPVFLNPEGCSADILATAALIAGVDLVVTVDTMVAHLAGALGRPALVLLRRNADWRWGLEGRTPWYPSLRLVRQGVEGDWSEPLAALAAEVTRSAGD